MKRVVVCGDGTKMTARYKKRCKLLERVVTESHGDIPLREVNSVQLNHVYGMLKDKQYLEQKNLSLVTLYEIACCANYLECEEAMEMALKCIFNNIEHDNVDVLQKKLNLK